MPAHDLDHLASLLEPMLAKLQPNARKQLTGKIATALRRSNAQRIAQQQNPDGTAYAPRRKLREDRQRIRKTNMFTKIRTFRYMSKENSADHVAVSFTGRLARIARVHQYGLRDRPSPQQSSIRYEQRELLGFSDADIQMIYKMTSDFIKQQ